MVKWFHYNLTELNRLSGHESLRQTISLTNESGMAGHVRVHLDAALPKLAQAETSLPASHSAISSNPRPPAESKLDDPVSARLQPIKLSEANIDAGVPAKGTNVSNVRDTKPAVTITLLRSYVTSASTKRSYVTLASTKSSVTRLPAVPSSALRTAIAQLLPSFPVACLLSKTNRRSSGTMFGH